MQKALVYDVWNFAYTYNCLPTHSWYCGVALLLAPTIAALCWNKGGWIMNRANTLAIRWAGLLVSVVGQLADGVRDCVDCLGFEPLTELCLKEFETCGAAAWLEFALPDDDCVPAEAFKTLNVACVAFLVAPDFLRPEVRVGLRDGGVAA